MAGKYALTVAAPYLEELARRRDEQSLTVRCLFCPWSWEGPAGDARVWARRHRERKHPDAVQTTTRRRRAA